MLEKLAVYQVDQCGYYGRDNVLVCSDLQKTLTDICRWIRSDRPTIEKTGTFEADEYLPVYCFDAASHGHHDFLITTWNETPSDNGAVGAVIRSEIAGNADVETANLPTNSIPGYGTHFWFLSDQRRLVTVRFDSQILNGHAGFNLFMRGYLERFSPHVRFDDASGGDGIFVRNVIGYAEDSILAKAHHGLKLDRHR